jgi:hypothetical protein
MRFTRPTNTGETTMQATSEAVLEDTDTTIQTPFSLVSILEPSAAVEAAARMQRWYRSTPQGASQSHFGRDGRKIEARHIALESADIDD